MTKNLRKLTSILLISLSLMAPEVQAKSHGVPGLKELKEFLTKQLTQMEAQYGFEKGELFDNAKSQLNSLKEQTATMTGSYGMGKLNNSLSELKARQYSPDSWKDALKVQAGGVNDRYRELVRDYEKNHPDVTETSRLNGLGSNKDEEGRIKNFRDGRAVNRAVSVQATYAYDNINKHLKNIYELSEKIDKTDNEKAATDLNSRMMAEIGYLQAEQIKQQALQNQQVSEGVAKALDGERSAIIYSRDETLKAPR